MASLLLDEHAAEIFIAGWLVGSAIGFARLKRKGRPPSWRHKMTKREEQAKTGQSISLGVQWICNLGHWNGPGVVPLDLIDRPARCQHMPFGGPYHACGRKVRDAELTARFVEGGRS